MISPSLVILFAILSFGIMTIFMLAFGAKKNSRSRVRMNSSVHPLIRFAAEVGSGYRYNLRGKRKPDEHSWLDTLYRKRELLIQQANNPWGVDAQTFVVIQFTLFATGMVAGSLVGFLIANSILALVIALLLGVSGWMYPTLVYQRSVTFRENSYRRELSDALNLVHLNVERHAFPQAVEMSYPKMLPGLIQEEFKAVSNELNAGRSQDLVLKRWLDRTPSESSAMLVRNLYTATKKNQPVDEVIEMNIEIGAQEYFEYLMLLQQKIQPKLVAVFGLLIFPALLVSMLAPVVPTLQLI